MIKPEELLSMVADEEDGELNDEWEDERDDEEEENENNN